MSDTQGKPQKPKALLLRNAREKEYIAGAIPVQQAGICLLLAATAYQESESANADQANNARLW